MGDGSRTVARVRGVPRQVQEQVRGLRRRMTPAERLLWAALRDRQVDGLKFRRQHPMGPFVLDFCCPERGLVVEVDGSIHEDPEQRQHDAMRTDQLAAFGYRVLRVRNEEVTGDLVAVVERIRQAATV